MGLKFKRKKTSLAKLRKENLALKRQVKSEGAKFKAEIELAKLKRERFKLKHRKGIRIGKAVFKGAKSGIGGARAIQVALRRGTIKVPKVKLKIKKRRRRKKKSKRRKQHVIIIRR